MNLTLSPEIQKLIDERLKSRQYPTPEDVVSAGLGCLSQQDHLGEFGPGELDKLLAVADAEIDQGNLLDGEAVFRELRELDRKSDGKAK